MDEHEIGMAPVFWPIGRQGAGLSLTRRTFVAGGLVGTAAGALLTPSAANACDGKSELQFLETSEGITVTHYPPLCSVAGAPPPAANIWFLARRAFGRDTKFLLRTLRGGAARGYELQVFGARFGRISPSFHWFVFQRTGDIWMVRMRTELWTQPGAELTSDDLLFTDLCGTVSADQPLPRFTLSTTSNRVETALKKVFEDHALFRGQLNLGFDSAAVWHLDGEIGLHGGHFTVRSLELAWCEPESSERTRASRSGGARIQPGAASASRDPYFCAIGEATLNRPVSLVDRDIRLTLVSKSSAERPKQAGAKPMTIPIRWAFSRQDWKADFKVPASSAGVSRISAPHWELAVSTPKSVRLSATHLGEGVLQSSTATKPSLQFAGKVAAMEQLLRTRVGILTCIGWSADNGALDPATASATSHHPSVRVTGTLSGALQSVDVPLLLSQADLAPSGCDFSELTFAPTSVRAIYASDASEANEALTRAQSYIWLGTDQQLSGLPVAHIDLSRAKLQASRVDSLAVLKFAFSGLYLDIRGKEAWITDPRESCRVVQSEPGGAARDTRPILVVEFPAQHVFEETVFRPSSPALPDAKLASDPIKVKRDDFSAAGKDLIDASQEWVTFSTEANVLLKQIGVFEDPRDRQLVRKALAAQKRSIDTGFDTFSKAFDTAVQSQADAQDLPVDQRVYIGPEGLDPDVAAIARRTYDTLRLRVVAERLTEMLKQADEVIGQLTDNGPASPSASQGTIVSLLLNLVKPRFDAARANQTGLPKAAIARIREEATASSMQEYGFFRDFYREQMTLKLFDFGPEARKGADPLPNAFAPDDLEYFSPSNREGITTDKAVLTTRLTDVLNAYAAVVCNQIAPPPFTRGRLSGASRLAFRLDCRRQLTQSADDPDEVHGSTRLPFTFESLTDWARFDMAVPPRAMQVPAFDDAGLLIRSVGDVTDEKSGDASEDIEMLRSLGITSGEFLTAQGRLSEVESSLRVAPTSLETSIELPSRLFLSPSQHAIWRTRRTDGRWKQSAAQPVPLWTASVVPSGPDPRIRAVYSPDLRPGFVRGGIESSLARAQLALPVGSGSRVHAPFVNAPPRGPRAPWTLGHEEGDSQTSQLRDLHQATLGPPLAPGTETKFKDDEALCEAQADKSLPKSLPAPTVSGDTLRSATATPLSPQSSAVASTAASGAGTGQASSAANNPATVASGEQKTPLAVHRLVAYLCQRKDDKREYGRAAIFRSSLDAYDRHEIVLLTSAWGLPVRGRREKSGQLQAVKISSQVELPPRWWPMDLEKGSALYRPRSLKIQELTLSTLGGTLRHDTDFIPPSAARHVAYGPLFDSMSVERWQHWTVLGRDVFAEVVYKGYLFPIGHRASLVKQTERVFLRHKHGGSVRAYLRQRMFIRVGQPDKTFPAVGQPNGGRQFPASAVRMLTTVTPDLVDPAEDTTNVQGSPADPANVQMIPSPAGRLFANEAGLAFWPRTARVAGTDVHFEMQIEDSSTSARLIFVDNVAINRPDLVSRLVDYYNSIPSPDLGAAESGLSPIESEHLRTIDLGGQARRYCEELTAGSSSHKTYSWTLKATGGQGTTPIIGMRSAGVDNNWEGIVRQFDDPTLEGADQPPFYPAVQTARIRIDQVERMAASGPMPVIAQFEGWYVKHGFSPSVAAKPELDPLEIYLNITSDAQMSMGSNGERSGGVFRPGGRLTALSRQRGPLIGSDPLVGPGRAIEARGALGTATKSGYPVAPYDDTPVAPGPPTSAIASGGKVAPGLDQYFPPKTGSIPETKILGLVSLSKLLEYIKVSDAAKSLPILKEAVEYSAAGGVAADSIRTHVVVPLVAIVDELWKHWQQAGERVKNEVPSFVGGLNEVFPDLDQALRDLREALGKARDAGDTQLVAALGNVYQSGKRLVDACGRAIANPLDRVQLALQQKLASLSTAVATYQQGVIANLSLNIGSLAASFLADEALRLRILGYPFDRISELSGLLFGLKNWFPTAKNDAIDAVVQALKDAPRQALTAIATALTTDDARTDDQLAQDVTRSLLQSLGTALKSAREFLDNFNPEPPSESASRPTGAVEKYLSGLAFWRSEGSARARTLIKDALADIDHDLGERPAAWRDESKAFSIAVAKVLKPLRQLKGEFSRPPPSLERASRVIDELFKTVFGDELLVIDSTDLVKALVDAYRRDARSSFQQLGDLKALPDQRLVPSKQFSIPANWIPLGDAGTLAGRAHGLATVIQRLIEGDDVKVGASTKDALSELGYSCLRAELMLQAAARGFSDSLSVSEGSLKEPVQLLSSIRVQIVRAARALDAVRLSSEDVRRALAKVLGLADAKVKLELFGASRSLIVAAIDWQQGQMVQLLMVSEELRKIDPGVAAPIIRSLNHSVKACKDFVRDMKPTDPTEASIKEWDKALPQWWPTVADEKTGAFRPIEDMLRAAQEAISKHLENAISQLSGGADQLIAPLAEMLKVVAQGYRKLLNERETAWKAASENAFALVRGVMLVQADKAHGYIPKGQAVDIASDGPLNDQLNLDIFSLEALATYPGANASISDRTQALRFLAYFIGGWFASTTTPQRIIQQARRISFEEVKSRILKLVNLASIREEIEQRIKLLIPSMATLTYDFETSIDPRAEAATNGIFKPKPDCALSVHTSTRVDLLNGARPTFESVGHLGAFDIKLVGDYDAVTLQFNGIKFRTTGGPLACDIQYSGFKIGEKLKFLHALRPFFDTKPGSGFYLKPLDRGIGLEAGYGLNVGTISFGTVSFFNISLNAAARLRFDDTPATFVASLSRRDAPFTISVAPYGGSGFFALEANTDGIVGFEASFEYGGAAAFAYGPLSGQGRLMTGIYIRTSKGGRSEISATFYAGGTAAIWIFNFGASLYVHAQPVNDRLVGNATFTFSFSVGIVDYDYHVGVQASIAWSGGGGGGGGAGSTAMLGTGVQTALSSERGAQGLGLGMVRVEPSLIKLTSSGPDALDLVADRHPTGAKAGRARPKTQKVRPAAICRQPRLIVDTVCQSQSWRKYHGYFDKLNVLENFDADERDL